MRDSTDILNAGQAAGYLKINKQTLRRLAREGKIPAFKVGGTWRFSVSWLDRWAESQQRGRAQVNILVVDDEPIVRMSVSDVLRRAGFNVATASGGVEALELMRQEVPDLVLLDLKMPGMDGPTTLQKIRQEYGPIPVVILTGYPDSELMNRALSCSPIMLLAKPPTNEQIVETVEKGLRGGAGRT